MVGSGFVFIEDGGAHGTTTTKKNGVRTTRVLGDECTDSTAVNTDTGENAAASMKAQTDQRSTVLC